MQPHTISVSLGSATAVVALEPEAAPKTCAALAGLLPLTATAHYAKIAGHEFYLHLPLFLDVEQDRRVADLVEGTLAFWPERQLLCVYYGSVQQEDATVTRLGRVVENLPGLVQAAEALRAHLGSVIPLVRLLQMGGDGMDPQGSEPPALRAGLARTLFGAYASIRDAVPADVSALMARRGIMQPVGVLICGEAETRKLHELAWLVRGQILADGTVPGFVRPILQHWAGRLTGWYGLPQAGALVADVAARLPEMTGDAAVEVVEGLILYIGRLSLWLDAYIPWEGINTLLHRTSRELKPARGRS